MSQPSWGALWKCRQAWLEGVSQLNRGNTAVAAEMFGVAVSHNPEAADAWLGLHASGVRRDEALEAMDRHAHSFGALRWKLGKPLASRFAISRYVTSRLDGPRDLWLAVVAKQLDEGWWDLARQRLSSAVLDCDETRFLCARYAHLTRDWARLAAIAEPIRDPLLRDQSQLYVAFGLVEQGFLRQALRVLDPLPQALGTQMEFLREVADLRGRIEGGSAAGPVSGGVYVESITGSAPFRTPGTGGDRAGSPARESGSAPSAEQRTAMLDEAMAELDAMVGLEPVKRQVRELCARLRMAAIRRDQGVGAPPEPEHLVFAGPPGTGKTSVARIVGKVFAGLGLLERGHLVEASRVDLVGQHLGSTALKTTGVIDSAVDGVLFIDEAYALVNSGYSGGDAFGTEAVQVLLKRAEDDRHRLVIVLAGYPDEMDRLLSANPGLASRFSTQVVFPAYSADELVTIVESFLGSQGDALTEDGEVALRACCEVVVADGLINQLGNGRFARELARKAAAVRDLRVHDLHGSSGTPSLEEVTTLLAGDVMDAYQELKGGLPPTA
nr:AAA family ATPase [Streptomyces sp. NBC_00239]